MAIPVLRKRKMFLTVYLSIYLPQFFYGTVPPLIVGAYGYAQLRGNLGALVSVQLEAEKEPFVVRKVRQGLFQQLFRPVIVLSSRQRLGVQLQ